jgi:hypothetical protein
VSQPDLEQLDLGDFIFGSLYFCGTRIESFRGPQLLRIINDYYMPFIRRGWGVPLGFVIDVSALLLFRGVAFTTRWKQAGLPEELTSLAVDYYKLLRQFTQHPKFQYIASLARAASTDRRRDATIKVFLRFLLTEYSEFRDVVPLKQRRLVIRDLQPTPEVIKNIVIPGRPGRFQFRFRDPDQIMHMPIIRVLAELMRRTTDYYREHSLDEFISDEELFMIDYAARSDASVERIDYHLLHRVLSGPDVDEPERWPTLNTMVEEELPTESYTRDGRIGGYVDVNRKRSTEIAPEILPSEFALIDHPEAMLHNLMNEGLLHYIREDVERIEPELRVLFCFVVDAGRLMRHASVREGPQATRGLTPASRGKAIVFDLLRDLALYFPRENVTARVVLYLWTPQSSPTYRDDFDLFDFEPARALSRYDFATDLAGTVSPFYHYELHKADQPEFVRLDPDPYRNLETLHAEQLYHSRHLVIVSSERSCAEVLPDRELGIRGDDYGRDSLWLILADTYRSTVGIVRPDTLSASTAGPDGLAGGQLTEDRLRAQFLETVLLKAAARRPRPLSIELGGQEDA